MPAISVIHNEMIFVTNVNGRSARGLVVVVDDEYGGGATKPNQYVLSRSHAK